MSQTGKKFSKSVKKKKKKKKKDKNKIQIILKRNCLLSYYENYQVLNYSHREYENGNILHVFEVWKQKYNICDFAFYARAQLVQPCNLVQAMCYS